MKLIIPNWKQGYKFISTWFHAAGLLLSAAALGAAALYGSLDAGQHAMLGRWPTFLIFLLIFLGAAIGRFIRQ